MRIFTGGIGKCLWMRNRSPAAIGKKRREKFRMMPPLKIFQRVPNIRLIHRKMTIGILKILTPTIQATTWMYLVQNWMMRRRILAQRTKKIIITVLVGPEKMINYHPHLFSLTDLPFILISTARSKFDG